MGSHARALEWGEASFQQFAGEAAFRGSVAAAYAKSGNLLGLAHFARRVLAQAPESWAPQILLAQSVLKGGHIFECIQICEGLRWSGDESPDLFSVLGQAYVANGQPERQVELLERARALTAGSLTLVPVLAAVELGYAHLRGGNCDAGWPLLQARWQKPDFPWQRRHFPQPVWNEEDRTGRRLLAWGEQGIGDEIMFAGVLADLPGQGVA